jgi:hypothetical protein
MLGVVEHQRETSDSSPTPAALLMLARELRDAAATAGRMDVVAKADEAIALITSKQDSAGTGEPQRDGAKGNAVIRILDGLGF